MGYNPDRMDERAPVKRRLTAILAADAVGYSARVARDEEGTLKTLAGHRRLIDGLISDYGGRIVGTAGDSVLAEFGSSVDAVRCAVEIQEALATRNGSLPERARLDFRIGVNLGDVIVDGTDILGDGVNVASRLEGIADPGGICIASSVFDQISGKLNIGFEDIGERSLKNIGRPVRAYRVARAGAPRPRRGRSRRTLVATASGAAVSVVVALAVVYFSVAGDQRDAATARDPAPAPPIAESSSPPAAVSQPGPTAPPVPAAPLPADRPAAQPAASPLTGQSPTAAVGYTMGLAHARCQRPDGSLGPFARGRVEVVAGEVIIAAGEPGRPGQIDLRGRPDPDGALVLEGFILPVAGRGRGAKVAARYEGRLTNGRGMLTGTKGVQRCSMALQLK